CRRERRSRIARSCNRFSAQVVELVEDRQRLGLEVALGRLVVGGRDLAQPEVQPGVAYLAVLGVLGRLELGAAVVGLGGRRGGTAQRCGDRERDEAEQGGEGEKELHGLPQAGWRASSRRTGAGVRARSRFAVGGRRRAISAPSRSRAPPSQIQATNGKTITRNVAAGPRASYIWASARMIVACVCASDLPNFTSAIATGRCRMVRSGCTAVQTSRPRPQRRATSLVFSPSKKRENLPAAGSAEG